MNRPPRAVAEVLVKRGVVLLRSRCGPCVPLSDCPVDHIEAALRLVQPQLVISCLVHIVEVHRAPLDIEDSIRRTPRYRGEDTAGAPWDPSAASLRISPLVIPVREDRVIVRSPR